MRPFSILYIVYVQNVFFTFVRTSSIISAQMELCGPETEIQLTSNGESSAAIIGLPSTSEERHTPCKLHINAPKSHIIYMQFTDGNIKVRNKARIQNNNTDLHHPTCIMHVILPDSSAPFWKGDLCSSKPLPPVDLLPSDFKILWNRPTNPAYINTGRKLVFTAVGQGIFCKENDQHTCMRIGRVPLLCVSNHLLCDGIYNCPKSSTKSDEDGSVCDKNPLIRTTWEQIAMEMIKKLKPPPPQDDQKTPPKKTFLNWQEWQALQKLEATTKRTVIEKETKTTDSISQMLAKYGPWGYLMLGLLICGTVLMFCGLWECCFKKQKDPIENGIQTQPTAVLIINQSGSNEETPNTPPNYDELEPPPSYSALFPNAKPNCSNNTTNTREENVQNVTTGPQNSVDV